MKYSCILIIPLLSTLTMSSTVYSHGEFPVLEGPYLGQKPPGLIPEVSGKSPPRRIRAIFSESILSFLALPP